MSTRSLLFSVALISFFAFVILTGIDNPEPPHKLTSTTIDPSNKKLNSLSDENKKKPSSQEQDTNNHDDNFGSSPAKNDKIALPVKPKSSSSSSSSIDFYLPPVSQDLISTFQKYNNNNQQQQDPWCASYTNGKCGNLMKKNSKSFFRLHHLHQHAFSIERKVVRLFGPVLAKYFCSTITQSKNVNTDTTGSMVHKALIIDVGVNDAEDIPYWFEKFGYFDQSSIFSDPSLSQECRDTFLPSNSNKNKIHIDFRLFEPQQMYRKQVEEVLMNQLKRTDVHSSTSTMNNNRHLSSVMTIHGAFDAVAVGSDEQHGTTAKFYGQGEQASLGSKGKHAAKGTPVEVRVGSLSKMLDRTTSWKKCDLEGDGAMNHGGGSTKMMTLHSGDEKQEKHQDDEKTSPPPILFMKVDCEGADPTILLSSEQLFASHRVQLLVFELHKNEKGFPGKFYHVVEMLMKHQYEVYLLGRCHQPEAKNAPKDGAGVPLRSLMLMKFTKSEAARHWTPILEGAIAVSPQMQKIMKTTTSSTTTTSSISEYFGGGVFHRNEKCGVEFEFVPYF